MNAPLRAARKDNNGVGLLQQVTRDRFLGDSHHLADHLRCVIDPFDGCLQLFAVVLFLSRRSSRRQTKKANNANRIT